MTIINSGNIHPAGSTAESLTKRGFLFLEDSDWKQADKYFNMVLDLNPESASAYIGLLCAELEVKSEADLTSQNETLGDMPNYKKALRFADADYRAKITGYNDEIKKRLEENPKLREQMEKKRKERERRKKEEGLDITSQFQQMAKDWNTGKYESISIGRDGKVVKERKK